MFHPLQLPVIRQRLLTWGATALLLSAAALGGCGKEDSPAPPAPVRESPSVQLTSNATLGSFLADGDKYTLYYFTRDTDGSSQCPNGPCLDAWPIFYDARLKVGNGLNGSDFTTITHSNGQKQTAYKGWPLYYFAVQNAAGTYAREKPGETRGSDIGTHWFVVRTDYTIMVGTRALTDASTNQPTTKNFLIDPQGRTLYTYGKDGKSPHTAATNCAGDCAAAWPVFYSKDLILPVSAKLKAGDFGTITRTDGANGATRQQTTYKGQPLYYCMEDNSARGKTEGQNKVVDNETWKVAEL